MSVPFPDSRCISIAKPYIIGYMSVDGERNYHSDLSQLKYLAKIPNRRIALDLNHGINEAIKRTTDDNDEKINLLLKFLLDQSHRLQLATKDFMFITYRRTLISVMCSAFDSKETLSIVATLYKGSIYLHTLDSPQDIQRRQSRSKQEEKFCAWGYKFEQYMLSDRPDLQPDIQKPVTENEEFSLYYRTRLGNHELLYGAQIDGLLTTTTTTQPPETTDVEINMNYLRNNLYAELKTNRVIQHQRQEHNFKKHKLLRCWCQCYLADLKGLLVGYRTDGGIVQRVQWFNTADLVTYCQNVWNPQTALKFLDNFLSHVKHTFKNELQQPHGDNFSSSGNTGPYSLQFEINVNKSITVNKNVNNIIIPDWYINGKS